MKRRQTALAAYIGTGSLYLMLVALLFAGAWGSWVFSTAVRRSIRTSHELVTRSVAGRLEEFLARPRQALDRLASLVGRPDLYSRGRLDAYLEDALPIYPFLDQVEVVGPDDRVRWLAPFKEGSVGILRRGESVYEGVKASRDLYWSDSYISLKNNAPAVTFGRRVGGYVILCDLDLSSLSRFTAPLAGEPAYDYELLITDKNGVLISSPDEGKVLRREPLTGFAAIRAGAGRGSIEVKAESGPCLASISRVPGSSWYVVILYPLSRLAAVFREYVTVFLAFLVIAFLLGLASIRFRVRRIARVLDALGAKATRISEGHYDELVDFGEGFLEFAKVGENFNGMIARIREREAELLDRERGFRHILEGIRLFVLAIDTTGRISFCNACLLGSLGYEAGDLLGRDLGALLPPGGEKAAAPFLLMARQETAPHFFECDVAARKGEARLVEWTIIENHDSSGAVSGVTGIGTDITEFVRQKRLLESSLEEKLVLLREVHHRVKNNLQLISSLLQLQKAEVPEGLPDDQLEKAQKRIRSIALVHEMLYEASDFGAFDLAGYAEALVRELLVAGDDGEVVLRCDLEPTELSLDQAVPCGLILNEIITNVTKYAFPPAWTGPKVVDLRLRHEEDGRLLVAVADSGVGLPPRSGDGEVERLGHTIVRLLSRQLDGELRIVSEGGTKVELRFQPQSRPGGPERIR